MLSLRFYSSISHGCPLPPVMEITMENRCQSRNCLLCIPNPRFRDIKGTISRCHSTIEPLDFVFIRTQRFPGFDLLTDFSTSSTASIAGSVDVGCNFPRLFKFFFAKSTFFFWIRSRTACWAGVSLSIFGNSTTQSFTELQFLPKFTRLSSIAI